jgi:putative lipoic acid-binding regulatory protein
MMNKPRITYPCRWSFTLIGSDETDMRAAAADCLGARDYGLEWSRQSRSGRYTSLHLDTTVGSEADRNRLFAALKARPAIKMVL